MENADLTARRRVARILGHVACSSPSDEAFPPSSFLLPLNCSSTLNTALIQRRDSRLMFARQGSNSGGRFMHRVSSNLQKTTLGNSCNNSSQQRGEPPLFSRNATCRSSSESADVAANSSSPPVPSSWSTNNYTSDAAPLFARKSCRTIDDQQQVINSSCNRTRPQQQQQQRPSINGGGGGGVGVEWCPRMDVVESRGRFVVTVELPGVQAAGIHLELDDEILTIMGKRSVGEWRRTAKGGGGGGCESWKAKNYHQREISEGPYRIVWPLPRGVNKDAVSAELLDGFLRITLPKL